MQTQEISHSLSKMIHGKLLPKGNGRNFYWKDDDGVYHDIIIDSD
jgi:hypothetical protein